MDLTTIMICYTVSQNHWCKCMILYMLCYSYYRRGVLGSCDCLRLFISIALNKPSELLLLLMELNVTGEKCEPKEMKCF